MGAPSETDYHRDPKIFSIACIASGLKKNGIV